MENNLTKKVGNLNKKLLVGIHNNERFIQNGKKYWNCIGQHKTLSKTRVKNGYVRAVAGWKGKTN